jgi:hypothetical protein
MKKRRRYLLSDYVQDAMSVGQNFGFVESGSAPPKQSNAFNILSPEAQLRLTQTQNPVAVVFSEVSLPASASALPVDYISATNAELRRAKEEAEERKKQQAKTEQMKKYGIYAGVGLLGLGVVYAIFK